MQWLNNGESDMKIKELKEYINTFSDNADFTVVIVDPSKKIRHICKAAFYLTDAPAIVIATEKHETISEFEQLSMFGTER